MTTLLLDRPPARAPGSIIYGRWSGALHTRAAATDADAAEAVRRRPRGDAHMTDVHALVADHGSAGWARRARPRTSRPNPSCSLCAHPAPGFVRIFPVFCSSTPSIIFPRRMPDCHLIAERWAPNLVTLRAETPAPGLWQDHSRARRDRHNGGCRSLRSNTTTCGSRASSRAARRRAPASPKLNRSRWRPQKLCKKSIRSKVDDQRRAGIRAPPRHPAAPALSARLHEHRLRAVHPTARIARWRDQGAVSCTARSRCSCSRAG